MHNDLQQLKLVNGWLLHQVSARYPCGVRTYTMVEYNDPIIGPVHTTESISIFDSFFDNLTVRGGGDCPEMVVTGLQMALEKSPYNSFILVLTDASAKDYNDENLIKNVYSLINTTQSKIFFLITGVCAGRTDPKYLIYRDIASKSFGHVFEVRLSKLNKVNKTHANYENVIYLKPDPSLVIYREEYRVNVSCIYPLTMNVSLGTVLHPIMSIKTFSITGFGNFEVKMAAFLDQGYQAPIKKGEAQISTKDRLFVGVFISKGDKEQFNLVMLQCYATPTNNPLDKVSYGIIVNSCPNREDGTIRILENGISTQGKFYFQVFKFVGDYTYVYLHCQVHLCRGSCLPVSTV
ncbi:hypothetical protein GDO81_016899 [Engystomops pustulosus]|nr:hypothetical protein GDO81_016899 [Engystomops pustulosus]